MNKELNVFFNSLMFYSRIPVPKNLECSDQILSKASRYLPLVGILVASIGATGFVLAHLVLPASVALLIALATIMLLTGCLHEDGFADFFDAFGGGQSKDTILAIMKDSHIGTYGAIALVFLVLVKLTTLLAMPTEQVPYVLLAAHGISRVYPIVLIKNSVYARQGQSKAQHTRNGIDPLSLTIAIILGTIPLVFFSYKFILLYLLLSLLVYSGYKRYLHKKIGGFTGDTLGALQQFMEILFYLTYLCVMQL